MFKNIGKQPRGTRFPRAELLAGLKRNADGLIPAIAQQHDTGEVLMMAWMNDEALEETLATGRVCYFSRSRGRLWRKGESSGQVQHLKALHIDCDGDTLLLRVDQTGPACHTGRSSCFFLRVDGDEVVITANPLIDPETLYGGTGKTPPGATSGGSK
ncbi:Phosphoribosyl-AMP cyclohydrolase [Thioalkalivibrio nitratireducens DSM 14787]|uniref:Phosphoribosyl-AMP cyclohydrolase n=1 Tax=Thioalkalivibrio nitratireducens (strain DSM 14787 / UNIQEM 213 / ALEN2) TaxID=1255043 RepID=L0DUA0_THIND|nr:phosphoribosyl-AMP cyclohydrolase [Thioalkalivibrio nitratireducens]AGA32575.1 Phosphoribosyl-AMP cyclohydrolase [Thioalkalivibrio nitratireducens DSM 14787]